MAGRFFGRTQQAVAEKDAPVSIALLRMVLWLDCSGCICPCTCQCELLGSPKLRANDDVLPHARRPSTCGSLGGPLTTPAPTASTSYAAPATRHTRARPGRRLRPCRCSGSPSSNEAQPEGLQFTYKSDDGRTKATFEKVSLQRAACSQALPLSRLEPSAGPSQMPGKGRVRAGVPRPALCTCCTAGADGPHACPSPGPHACPSPGPLPWPVGFQGGLAAAGRAGHPVGVQLADERAGAGLER